MVDVGAEDAIRRITPPPVFFPGAAEVRLVIRSVGEIFQFLGDLVYCQEALRKHLDANPPLGLTLNTPVPFG